MGNEVRCTKDLHSYDPTIHSDCPFCEKTYIVETLSSTPKERDTKDSTVLVGREKEGNGKTRVIFSSGDDNKSSPPTVGWLVVVDGPGKGRDISVEPGQNRIGRSPSMNIQINFGDEGISRKEHAFLIYDHQNNAYFIKHGNSQNLTYLNGAMIMDMQPLKTHDIITLGKTKLLFIPLCSKEFNWDKEF